jgi:hypothetical protein
MTQFNSQSDLSTSAKERKRWKDRETYLLSLNKNQCNTIHTQRERIAELEAYIFDDTVHKIPERLSSG